MTTLSSMVKTEVLSVRELEIKGSICVECFLTNFDYMDYKANPYVEELVSRYVYSNMYVDQDRGTIFTYFDIILNDAEIDTESKDFQEDVQEGLIRVCEDGGFVYYETTELVHWSIDIHESNVAKATFYIHAEDFLAIHSYLWMLKEENGEVESVDFEIIDGYLTVNEEFKIRLYD